MNSRSIFPLAPLCALIVVALLSSATPFARGAAADRIVPFGGAFFDWGISLQPDEGENGAGELDEMKPDPAGPHRLEFGDGTQLRGTLQELNSETREIVWRRADVSGSLRLPMGRVARLTLGGKPRPGAGVHATVKLTGGDWLTADAIGAQGNRIQLKLGDGSAATVDRAQIEWIYFSRGSAAECYDGPTSLAGWVSEGGWTYREGALWTALTSPISRHFEALPDQVEYFFEIDQGGDVNAFSIALHSQNAATHGVGSGSIQLMLRGESLRLTTQIGGAMKTEQVDLTKTLRAPGELGAGFKLDQNKPLQFRILEDHPGGRLAVFINGRKAAEWNIDKGKAGANRGGIVFRPMRSNPSVEQSLSRVRVAPWDGRAPEGEPSDPEVAESDRVSLISGEVKVGKLESLTRERLKLRTSGGLVELPGDRIVLLRLGRAKNPPEEDPTIAHVRLAERGEFDVAGIGFREGTFSVRTNFGGELLLAPGAVRAIGFSHAGASSLQAADVLVFKNGDRLRGFIGKADGQTLSWRGSAESSRPVQIDPSRVAGVLFAKRAEKRPAKCGLVARFRNGDFLAGDFVTLDQEQFVMNTPGAGQLAVLRDRVQALFFSADGTPPVQDGATDYETWQRGMELARQSPSIRPAPRRMREESASPWRYFDGSFTFRGSERVQHNVYGGSASLGCWFASMPLQVELSFDVTSRNSGVFFSAQLFYDPEFPGYMLQFHSEGMFVYDMAPRLAGRGMPQQLQFRGKVEEDARQRRIRLLADRRSGKLTIIVDGVVLGQFGQKTGERARHLGTGLMLLPQPNISCTFSNLWVGPWNGQMPDKAPALTPAGPETVLLANGDEAQGTIKIATPEVIKLDGDLGPLEIPSARLTMIDFGGQPAPRATGARLRLVDRGTLTLRSYRIEDDAITVVSEMAGELKIPLAKVQEIAFTIPALAPAGEKRQPPER